MKHRIPLVFAIATIFLAGSSAALAAPHPQSHGFATATRALLFAPRMNLPQRFMLERDLKNSFQSFANEWRSRHATTTPR